MGIKGFLQKTGLNKPLKFAASGMSQPIRGVGRIARGKFKEGFSDIGKGIAKNATIAGAIVGAPYLASGLGAAAGGVGSAMGGIGAAGGASGAAGAGGFLSKLGGLGGALRSVGSFAKSNPDAILGALSAYQGRQAGKKADGMMDRALNDPGLNPERPDFSSTFGGYDNVYSGAPNPFGAEARQPMDMMDRGAPLRRIGRRYA